MKNNSILIIFGFLLAINILAWVAVYELSQPRHLEVNFFDIGQGDATFIETPARHQILIDGGPSSEVLEKLAGEMPFYDRSIDLIILTHPEHDHLAGLIEVLKRYEVKNILWTGVVKDTADYNAWLKAVKEEGARIFIAKSGQEIKTTGPDQINFLIFYPLEQTEGQAQKDTNDTSIVTKLVFKENSFLFAGDVSKSAEREILGAGLDIDSDVLKVAHHGSKTSSAEEFIEKVSPEIAVISAGKENPYGHPHQETLEILNKYGITIFRTDLNGDIKIISNGKTLRIFNSQRD